MDVVCERGRMVAYAVRLSASRPANYAVQIAGCPGYVPYIPSPTLFEQRRETLGSIVFGINSSAPRVSGQQRRAALADVYYLATALGLRPLSVILVF